MARLADEITGWRQALADQWPALLRAALWAALWATVAVYGVILAGPWWALLGTLSAQLGALLLRLRLTGRV